MTRFMRVGRPGAEVPVVATTQDTYDLRGITADIDGAFLAGGGLERARELAETGRLPPFPVDGLRIGAPVARPAALICVGQNYAAHAAESGAEPPEAPIIFFKHPNTLAGPFDDIVRPAGAQALDWEVELALVIGRPASSLATADDGRDAIAGYMISHDVSERAWQLNESGGQWSKGKSAEGFNPAGPWLVPSDELRADDLRIRSWVNGQPRQDSRTSDMIFSPGEIVRDLSQYLRLEAGDIVNTGTPQGVGLSGRYPYLADGDVVRLAIEGLGEARQRIVPSRIAGGGM